MFMEFYNTNEKEIIPLIESQRADGIVKLSHLDNGLLRKIILNEKIEVEIPSPIQFKKMVKTLGYVWGKYGAIFKVSKIKTKPDGSKVYFFN